MHVFVKKSVPTELITNTCIPINWKNQLTNGVLIDEGHLLQATHVPHKKCQRVMFKNKHGKRVKRSISEFKTIGNPYLDLSLLKLKTPLVREDHEIFDISPIDIGEEVLIYRTTMFGNRRPFISRVAARADNLLCAMAGDSNKSMLMQGDSGLPWFAKRCDGSYGVVALTSRIWYGIGPDLYSIKDEIEATKQSMN